MYIFDKYIYIFNRYLISNKLIHFMEYWHKEAIKGNNFGLLCIFIFVCVVTYCRAHRNRALL